MNRQAVAKRESESSEDALVHTPQSPVNPPIHVVEETDSSTAVIVIPPSPIRKNSDASRPTVPRYDWYQTEKNLMIHIFTHNKARIRYTFTMQYRIVCYMFIYLFIFIFNRI